MTVIGGETTNPSEWRGLTRLVAREPYRPRLPGRHYHLARDLAGWRAFRRAGTLHASLDIYDGLMCACFPDCQYHLSGTKRYPTTPGIYSKSSQYLLL